MGSLADTTSASVDDLQGALGMTKKKKRELGAWGTGISTLAHQQEGADEKGSSAEVPLPRARPGTSLRRHTVRLTELPEVGARDVVSQN
jgi:hypothetical protein